VARSVRVELILDTLKGVKGAKDLSKATDDVADSLGKTAREGELAGKAVDNAGEQMSQTARAVDGLDRQIDKLTRDLKQMAIAQALGESGSGNLTRQIRLQEAEVRRLTKTRGLLGDAGKPGGGGLLGDFGKLGTEGAEDFATSFGAKVGPLMANLPVGAPLAAVLGGAAITAAPFIGATISAAVIGGAGIGGVIGGVILAAKDSRVQAAGTELGARLLGALRNDASVFVAPVLSAISLVGSRFDEINGKIQNIFQNASRFVAPLVDGATRALQSITGGVDALVTKAGPVINVISQGIADVGKAIGDLFLELSSNGAAAAVALQLAFELVTSSIRSIAITVDALSKAFGFLAKLGAFGQAAQAQMIIYEASAKLAKNTTTDLGVAASITAATVKTFDERMTDATNAVKSYSNEIHAAFSDQLSLDQATLQLANGAKTLRDELSHGTRTLSLNSAEGRKNRGAVLDQLSAIENLRQARVNETGSTQQATREYNTNIGALRRSMLQAGFTKGEVDALIGSYRKVPGKVNTAIGTPGLPQSDKGIKDYGKKLNNLARKINTVISVEGKARAESELASLLIQQQALKKGISVSAAASAFRKNAGDGYGFAGGGFTGPGSKYQPAGVVHAGEFVFSSEATSKIGVPKLNQLHQAARGYAGGGPVLNAPFPVNAAVTRIPSLDEALAVVAAAVPGGSGGGPGYKWMERVARAAFPGIGIISDYRPGAVTLTGNRSYHAVGRAVDFSPSKPFAEWVNARYFARTKELITPWQSLNIHNGARHHYSPLIENQHSGSNAHDHWAMQNGGWIPEPVYGVGRSGRTYSFAENGRPERVLPAGQSAAAGPVHVTNNFTINGANHNLEQIATAVERRIGRTVSIYARGAP
jgi:hypothetical protein